MYDIMSFETDAFIMQTNFQAESCVDIPDAKDEARARYAGRYRNRQDHGDAGAERVNRYRRYHSPYQPAYDAPRRVLTAMSAVDVAEFIEEPNELDVPVLDAWGWGADDITPGDSAGVHLPYTGPWSPGKDRQEAIKRVERTQRRAEELLQQLQSGEMSKTDAYRTFMSSLTSDEHARVSAFASDIMFAGMLATRKNVDSGSHLPTTRVAEDLEAHLRANHALAPTATLEANPFEDTDYLDGFSFFTVR